MDNLNLLLKLVNAENEEAVLIIEKPIRNLRKRWENWNRRIKKAA